MTELELYKFVHENECEWRWDDEHLLLTVPYYFLQEFCDMLGYEVFVEGLPGEQWLLYDGSVGLNRFEEVCEHEGIDTENVFPKVKK